MMYEKITKVSAGLLPTAQTNEMPASQKRRETVRGIPSDIVFPFFNKTENKRKKSDIIKINQLKNQKV